MTAHTDNADYQKHLFDHLPLYSTRLVRETKFTFSTRKQVAEPKDVAGFLREYYADKDREEFLVVLLDSANTIIGLSQISVGGLHASVVEPRQIFKTAILANAAAIIVAHNHPSGNAVASNADIRITRRLDEAGEIMGIPLRDHLVITPESYTSLAEEGVVR